MKLHEIVEGRLYQRGATYKLPLADKQFTLAQHNIRSIVNLTTRRDAELASWNFIDYAHWAFADNRVPPTLPQIVEFVIGQLGHGAVLVHCNAGRNRASLVTAAVLIQHFGFTPIEAIEHVRRIRPNALANDMFVRYLTLRS